MSLMSSSSSSSSSVDLRSLLPDGWRESPTIKISRPRKKTRRCRFISFVRRSASKTNLPPTVSVYDPGYYIKETAKATAEKALLTYNQKSLPQGPEYEFVKALYCIFSRYRRNLHCNFIARPKINQSDDKEDKLFFAELDFVRDAKEDDDGLRCLVCSIIGPRFTRTGECGCRGCKRRLGLIQHPPDINPEYWNRDPMT